MVESNVVPTLTASKACNTTTQEGNDTAQVVKRRKIGPLGTDSSQSISVMSTSGKCGLTTTHPGLIEDKLERQKERFLVWNCSELSVNTARRITTKYSNMKAENYSMKKVIQPNGEKRFDIWLGAGANVITNQRWERVAKALHARIKPHNPNRRRSDVQPLPKLFVPMDESFSAMTYNINGLWVKRQEVFLLLGKTCPTVVALQETLKTTSARSCVPRYQVIETSAKPGGGLEAFF